MKEKPFTRTANMAVTNKPIHAEREADGMKEMKREWKLE
jgi:hypothetical protein